MPTVTRNATAIGTATGWTNPTNVLDQDDDVATYTIAAKNTTGFIPSLSTFGFDGVIPVGATINSVQVDVRQMVSTTGGVAFLENRLVVGGVNGATNSDSLEPTTLTTRTYSNYARPGGGAWTRDDLLDGTLVAQIWARSGNNATSVVYSWAWITVTVDYTDPAPTLAQGNWRLYTDATPDGSMSALAAENTAPTLTGAQMQNGIIRLRAQINETAGGSGTSGALGVEYSQDGTNWQPIEAQTPVAEGDWFRHANGAATDGATIGSQLLTGTTVSGKYHETGTATETITGNGKHEVDFAILVHWPPSDIPAMKFRFTSGGVPISLDAGASQITFNTCAAADRPNTIAYIDPQAASTADPETLWYGSNRRIFYDGTRWWIFYVEEGSNTSLKYQNWSGSGAWSSKASTSFSLSGDGIRNQHYLKVISGTPVIMSCLIRSSSSHRYKRGTISGTTITWGSEGQVSTQVPGTYGAVTCDDGNFWWVAWADPAGTLYAVRSTNADSGSSWTAGWQTPKSLSDANIGSWAQVCLVPLASDKVLVLYHARDTNDLIAVTCTDAGGFGTPVIVNEVGATGSAQCNHDDWGVVRSGDYVYVVHTTSASPSTGTWQLKVYSVSGNSWTQGPSPNLSMTTGSTDMAPLAYDSANNKLYLFRTGDGAEGGEDRVIHYETYSGPGDGGTWDNNATQLSTGSRGNMDAITCTQDTSGGKIVVGATWGDDSLLGTGYAIEYWTVSTASGVTATTNRLSVASSMQAATATGAASVPTNLLTASASMQSAQGLGGALGVGGLLSVGSSMQVATAVGEAVAPTSRLSVTTDLLDATGLGDALAGPLSRLQVLASLYAATAVESTDVPVNRLQALTSLYAAQGVGGAAAPVSLLSVLASLYAAQGVGGAVAPTGLLSVLASLYQAQGVGGAVAPTGLLTVGSSLYPAQGIGAAQVAVSLLTVLTSLYPAQGGGATIVPVPLLTVAASLYPVAAVLTGVGAPTNLLAATTSLFAAQGVGGAQVPVSLLSVGSSLYPVAAVLTGVGAATNRLLVAASMLTAQGVGGAVVPVSLLSVASSLYVADGIVGSGVLVGRLLVTTSLPPATAVGGAVAGPTGLLTTTLSPLAAQGAGGALAGPTGLLTVGSSLYPAQATGAAAAAVSLLSMALSALGAGAEGAALVPTSRLALSSTMLPASAGGSGVAPTGRLEVGTSLYSATGLHILLIPVATLVVGTSLYAVEVVISEAVLYPPHKPSVGHTYLALDSVGATRWGGDSAGATRYKDDRR